MKKPRCIELAEQYCEKTHGFNNHEYDAFLAGFDAALAVVQAELKLVQEHRKKHPGLGGVEYALKAVLEQLEN